ncbi:hypothetical protein L5515_005262 [Caenorhabditis briggsae]|uniref:F-box domain-containing protein n=1 Tax=Caenorhabditis briggsae TaxID=6238 RepID=A0AAE9EJT3_CAEBR|nr:hypothetical protein L5515_005262 [Caenorhabditis briggsae]
MQLSPSAIVNTALLLFPNSHCLGLFNPKNRWRITILDLIDVVIFSVTVIMRQLRLIWLFLCHSYFPLHVIVYMISTGFFRIVSLFEPQNSLKNQTSMKNRDRFPLLHLDYVAVREVLNVLDPIDYRNFSKTSKACRILLTTKKPYKVELTFTKCPVFMIGDGTINHAVRWVTNQEEHGIRTTHTWPDELREYVFAYSYNPLTSMKEFYLYARSLMGIEIHTVRLEMIEIRGQLWETVDWLHSTKFRF